MRTVQISLNEQLIADVDRAATKLGTTRSGFTRSALRAALRKLSALEQERRHRAGYLRRPVRRGEFDLSPNER
jgi:metal-responsive CopG/Arc/MetJ family transcriptional regulator